MSTTITLTRQSVCAGNEHVQIAITATGLSPRTIGMSRTEFLTPVTNEELEGFAKIVLRAHGRGMTLGQINTALIAGISVDV